MQKCCLAVILARGGSKRIPHKNTKLFLGKPIFCYAIDTAKQSGLFDEVMVSTDDKKIGELAEQHGAVVPFLRSPSASSDHATVSEAVEEVLVEYLKRGKRVDYCCCILATGVLMKSDRLREAFTLLKIRGYTTVFPVVRFSYPIFRALKLEGDKATMLWAENKMIRSQDLHAAYHDAGQFYWLDVEKFMGEHQVFSSNSGSVVLSNHEAHDIDTEEDWCIAEEKYLRNNIENFLGDD